MPPRDYADIKPDPVADTMTNGRLDIEGSVDVPAINGCSNEDMLVSNGCRSPQQVQATTTVALDKTSLSAVKSRSLTRSPIKKESNGGEGEKKTEGSIPIKLEPSQPARLSRSSSKVVARPSRLFDHLPNSTTDAQATFETMDVCTYTNKYMGSTEHAMECDCAEEWGKLDFPIFLRWCFLFAVIRQTHLSPGYFALHDASDVEWVGWID
jgi:[histone H3]-lysine36 N-trimethyltransferase